MAYNGYSGAYNEDGMDIEATGPKVTVREVRCLFSSLPSPSPSTFFHPHILKHSITGHSRPRRFRPTIHLSQPSQLPSPRHPSRSPHRVNRPSPNPKQHLRPT